jgi:uncharacterized low-complexity protein
MRKSVILVAALALSVVTVAQAAPTKHHRAKPATRVVQQQAPAPAKDPMCNNGYEKGNMNWQEHYHCFGK